MADDLDDAIQENAQGPAKASGDSGSVEQHSLKDQIEAGRLAALSLEAAPSRMVSEELEQELLESAMVLAVAELYDERFGRMWEFYLLSVEIAFRFGSSMVFQMQLAKRADVALITRDYMIDWERENLDVPDIAPVGVAAE